MPEPTRYFTFNHEVPNGGVPPGRMFASVADPPNRPEPPYLTQPPYAALAPYIFHGLIPMGPPALPFPFLQPAATPSPPFRDCINFPLVPMPTYHASPPWGPYEPPGQTVAGQVMQGAGWSYISPQDLTTIHFVGDGVRPIDYPNGFYPHQFRFSKHKVPSIMSIRELISQLGCPEGPKKGVTEMVPLGDNRWAAGSTYTQGADSSAKSLAEEGWTAWRTDDSPIWLVVKR